MALITLHKLNPVPKHFYLTRLYTVLNCCRFQWKK